MYSVSLVDFVSASMIVDNQTNTIYSDEGSPIGFISGTTVWVHDPAFFVKIASICDRYTLNTGIYTYARPAYSDTCAVED